MSRRPTLEEPVEIGKIWKSPRNRKQMIAFALKAHEGHVYLDCRLFDTNTQGQAFPTPKGVTVGMATLLEFAGCIDKAVARARELGLIDDEKAEA